MNSFWIKVAQCCLILLCATGVLSAGQSAPIRSKLPPTSRARLALAYVNERKHFVVIIASNPGKNPEVANAISILGGTVLWRDDRVDYLRASLPIGSVETVANRSDIASIDADDSPLLLNVAIPESKSTVAADDGPFVHPYLPGRDIQTLALRQQHATYDGRGVTLAVVDGTPDFLLPELQLAKAANGTNIPKFLDIRTAEDPRLSDRRSVWLPTQVVRAFQGRFVVSGSTYIAPYNGVFRFAAISNQPAYHQLWSALHLTGRLQKGTVVCGILWDERTKHVWVDTNRNQDFRDERALQDYAIHHDFGTFSIPTTNPQARPTLGFVVQTDPLWHHVALLLGSAEHSTGVAGSIAANELTGGRIEGIAPGARLYSISPTLLTSSIIEAVLTSAKNPLVDEIVIEFVSAEMYGFHDGRFTESIIFGRAVRKYHKSVFVAAGNEFGMSRVSEGCGSPLVFCIGAYEQHDSYLRNAGIDVAHSDNVHFVDSFGPFGNGALRPEVLAPSGWLSLNLGYQVSQEYNPNFRVLSVPPLPFGYSIFGGTSQATPTAAGAVAVLLSAARQEALSIDPERLITAVAYTARYLPNLPAYVQGNGVIQVKSALTWLKDQDAKPVSHLVFEAPVRTVTSWSLPIPNRGVGLFEREGWSAGERGVRTVWITRLNGSSIALAAHVALVGNDGTFKTSRDIRLPLGHKVPCIISVAPMYSGAHSAILRIRSGGEVLGETLLTVVAGEKLSQQHASTLTRRVLMPRPGYADLFVTIPRGAQALAVSVSSNHKNLAGQEKFSFSYDLWMPDATMLPGLWYFAIDKGVQQEIFPHPRPGTWEFLFNDDRDILFYHMHVQRALPTPVTVKLSLLRAGTPKMFSTRQRAYASSHTGVIRAGEQRVYDIIVPPGTTGIGSQLRTSPGNSIALYLFYCATRGAERCENKTKSTSTSSKQYLYYSQPRPGLWKLLVDGYIAPKKGISYELAEYFLNSHLPASFRSEQRLPAAVFKALGDNPYVYRVYDQDLPDNILNLPRRKKPIIVDVQLPTVSK